MEDSLIAEKRELFSKINSKIRSTLLELLCFWPLVLLFFILISLRLDEAFQGAWSYLFIIIWWILLLAAPRVALFHYMRWEILKNDQLRGWYSHRVFTTIFEMFYSENDGSVPEISIALIGVIFFSILVPLRLDGVNFPWTIALALPPLLSAVGATAYRWTKTTIHTKFTFAATVFSAVFITSFMVVLGLKLDGIITSMSNLWKTHFIASWWLVNIPVFVLYIGLPALVVIPYLSESPSCVFLVTIVAVGWFSPLILFHFFVVLKITGLWSASWAALFIPLHVWWVVLFVSFWAFVWIVGTAK